MEPIRVHLCGSPREIGIQHGRLLKKQIHRQIKFYEEMFKKNAKLSWDEVLDVAREFEPTLRKHTPDLLEEMSGIAEGLADPGIGVFDIIALNCRSEIAMGKWSDGCTAVGFNPGLPSVQFLAQNWDWEMKMKDNIAMMCIEKPGKSKIWMVTEAGLIGKIGFNSSSVGVCLNAIRAKAIKPTLLPIHVFLRLVLESESMTAAINKLRSLGGSGTSAHILIADATGSRGVEVSPNGICILDEDENHIVAHTNHFINNHLVDEPRWLEDSPFRLKRIAELSSTLVNEAKSGRKVTIETVRGLFRDRQNAPAAICRSEDANDIVSLFNIVMVLGNGHPMAEVVFNIGDKDERPIARMPW